jgi:fatty-acid desaturase
MNIFSSSTRGAQLFFATSLILSLIGIYFYGIDAATIGLIFLGYFIYGCLGIVVTFHRLLTHRSYVTYTLIEKIFTIFGTLAGTGSSLAWVAIHINHHIKSDKIGDPHSPLHKGLRIFTLSYESEVDASTKWRMRSLVTDPYHQFLHRYYFLIIAAWSLILYLVGGAYLVIFFYLAPAAVTGFMSNVVNYVGHNPNWLGGFRRYKLSDQSTNNWLWAIPSWGEAWHNNHHRHPKNFSCGEKWWEIDISAVVIRLIKKYGSN